MDSQRPAVSHAKPPLHEYAPAPLREQVREIRKQLAIVRNVVDKKLRHDTIHPGMAAAELQSLQSALHTLEALEAIAGPDTALSADELRKRLVLQPEQGA